MTDTIFPSWIEERLVGDAAFARAYAAVSDRHRALLKTALARAWEWAGPAAAESSRYETLGRSGLASVRLIRPRRFAVLLFDETENSPARLLAALTPVLAAGVPDVLALRVGGRSLPPAPVLTALELAGVERLARLSRERALKLLRELDPRSPGLILGLGAGAVAEILAACPPSPWRAVWRGGLGGPLGVWRDKAADLDLEALAFAQPDAAVEVWGAGRSLPGMRLSKKNGTFESFLTQGYPVVWVPAARREACLDTALAVFGPGAESCWVWPDLQSLTAFEQVAWRTA